MKSPSRIALAIIAVVALVAGITFIYQGSPSVPPTPAATPPGGVKAAEVVKVTFPKGTIWEWEPLDGQFEQHSQGYKDFLFQNDNSAAIELGLKAKSCKCSEVSIGLTKDPAAAADLKLQPLAVDDLKGVLVGPGEGGVIRLAWEDKKEKASDDRSERLVVDVWAQAQGGGPRSIYKLELPVTFVPALRVRPEDAVLKVPDLYVNGKETKEFKCWS